MNAELLNLDRHQENAIAGKLIELNGATYLLGDRVDDGAEFLVHPMRNLKSGFTWFVAKIYKCRPGSVAFEERAQGIGFCSFLLELAGDADAAVVSHLCEMYAQRHKAMDPS